MVPDRLEKWMGRLFWRFVMINKEGLSPNKLTYWLSSLYLKITGWRVEGKLPDIPKFVIIAAPHTSNWDFPITLAVAYALKMKIYWMGKAVMFRWPFGSLCRWLGGIPIDRSKSTNVVDQAVQAFQNMKNLIMVVPPEGTRKKVRYWKTGFYHIANGANVPIALGFLDYRRKAGGIGPLFFPTGDIDKDMRAIQAFYATITGKRHDQFSNAVAKSS
jgi:1-acyl-sn-glycerol-3-phosphate acyltransferase